MKHWIVDQQNTPVPTWQAAMPEVVLLARDKANQIPSDEKGVIWVRLRAGEAVEEVLAAVPVGMDQHLVVLCDEPDEAVVMSALSLGASGCCNTHAAPEVLQQVSMVVGNGGLWVGHALLQKLVGATARVFGQQPKSAKNQSWASLLSEREVQVAQLVASGASNKEIASQLEVTERTVKAHLTTIFEKLEVRDRLQLSLKVNGHNL